MLCVCLPVRCDAETCCILFSVIDMLDGTARGVFVVEGGGGNGLISNFVCIAKGLIYKTFTLQRYSDKNHKFLFSRRRVKNLDHKESACIVCMTKYMRFGLIAYLQTPLIVVYFGVSRRTLCLKVVLSLFQHSYFVYARCKSTGKAMILHRLVGAFATCRCLVCADQFIVQHKCNYSNIVVEHCFILFSMNI